MSRSPSPKSTSDIGERSKNKLFDLENSGKPYTTEDVSDILFTEMEEVLQEEYEKERAKLPKVKPPKEPKTQKEKCAVG